MSLEIKHHLTALLVQALQQVAPSEPASLILLERPKQAEHGDYACNIAMQLARSLKRKPRELAEALVAALPASDWLHSAEIAGPGFINFTLATGDLAAGLATIIAQGAAYGRPAAATGKAVNIHDIVRRPNGIFVVTGPTGTNVGDLMVYAL